MASEETEHRDLFNELPADFASESERLVSDVFKVIFEQTRQLTNDLAEFGRDRKETKERIRRGARRTSGRGALAVSHLAHARCRVA